MYIAFGLSVILGFWLGVKYGKTAQQKALEFEQKEKQKIVAELEKLKSKL